MIRPEVAALLQRWRRVLYAAAMAALGLWILWRGGIVYGLIGGAVGIAGLALALSEWRRLRFRQDPTAPGVVQVDEGRIAYFGPLTGGAVALSELSAVETLDVAGHRCWRLRQADGQALLIPMAAAGAEALFDVFVALPHAATEAFLIAQTRPAPEPRTIWQRAPVQGRAALPRA